MDTTFQAHAERFQNLNARRAAFETQRARAVSDSSEEFERQTWRLSKAPYFDAIRKSATSAIVTTDPGLDVRNPLADPVVDAVREETVIGRSPGVRYVPPAVPITVVDTASAASNVEEGAPIPVVRPTLTDHSLTPSKIATIVPYSNDAFRVTDGKISGLAQRDTTRAVAIREDAILLDGAAAVAGLRPASVLAGLTPLVGSTAADIEAEVIELLGTVRGGRALAPVFVADPDAALYLAGLRIDGQRVFPDVTFRGGSILGVRLLVSMGAQAGTLALIDADALLVVDGGIVLDVAREAAFVFDTAPAGGGQPSVSLWQTNAVALKLVRYIGWKLAVADGAAYMTLPTGVMAALTLDQYHALAQRLDENPAAAVTFDELAELSHFEGESTRVKRLRDRLIPRPVVTKSITAPTSTKPRAHGTADAEKDAALREIQDQIRKAAASDDLTLDFRGHPFGADMLEGWRKTWDVPVTFQSFAAVMGAMTATAIKNVQRNRRIVQLEKRVEALEKRPASLKYAGVWSGDETYLQDDAVTDRGSLWIAVEKCSPGIRPGESESWQLAVKRGRDRRSE
jgi:HK97 family phage major capsid protein